MTPEEKSLLERTYKLAEENNGLLKHMRRNSRLALAGRILYWVVILGFGVSSFYFIKPYLSSLADAYGSFTGGSSFQDLFK